MALTNIITVFLLALAFALPIFTLLVIWPNYRAFDRHKQCEDGTVIYNRLQEPGWNDRFSSIYDMLDLKHNKPGAIFAAILFLLRRLVFVIGVIYFIDYPVF